MIKECISYSDGGSFTSKEVFDKQKFAKMLIEECCQVLIQQGKGWEEFSRNPPRGQENNASAALFAAFRLKEDAVSEIKQHFGVEE